MWYSEINAEDTEVEFEKKVNGGVVSVAGFEIGGAVAMV